MKRKGWSRYKLAGLVVALLLLISVVRAFQYVRDYDFSLPGPLESWFGIEIQEQ